MAEVTRLTVLAGPTAVGKGSVTAWLREQHPEIWISVSATTRARRPGEVDGVDPAGLSAADAASQWAAYLSTWTAWNHVRTATALVGAALMLIGLRDR